MKSQLGILINQTCIYPNEASVTALVDGNARQIEIQKSLKNCYPVKGFKLLYFR